MDWGLTFDVLLGLGLILLVWRALTIENLFAAVVLFIVYGILLAAAWVRLEAPDVALAEAAIGAGLTGALLLEAVGYMRQRVEVGATVKEGAEESAG